MNRELTPLDVLVVAGTSGSGGAAGAARRGSAVRGVSSHGRAGARRATALPRLAVIGSGLIVFLLPALYSNFKGGRCLTHIDTEGLSSLRELLSSTQNWTKKAATQAQVEVLILDSLYEALPRPPFSNAETEEIAGRVYNYVWQRSASGQDLLAA